MKRLRLRRIQRHYVKDFHPDGSFSAWMTADR